MTSILNPDKNGYFYLFYYTRAENLAKIINNNVVRIKVTQLGHSNDPLEILPSFDTDNVKDSNDKIDILDFKSFWYERTRDSFHPAVCMSSNCSSLLMWGHYADSHKGVCLVFRFKSLLDIEKDYIFFPVIYSKDRLKFKNYIVKNPNGNLLASEKLIKDLLSIKPLDWSYEREFRFLLDEGLEYENGSFYTTSLSRKLYGVILGAHCAMSTRQAEAICRSIRYKGEKKDKPSKLTIVRARISEKEHMIICKPFVNLSDEIYGIFRKNIMRNMDWDPKKKYDCIDLKTGASVTTYIKRTHQNCVKNGRKEIALGTLSEFTTISVSMHPSHSIRIDDLPNSGNTTC